MGSAVGEEGEMKREVAPTNESVQAFIATLVDPKIPDGCFIESPPSKDEQDCIARQMHAVVLLYNYYHRKQNPDLVFLDFVPFCKLALSVRSKLKPFMRTIDGSEATEFSGPEDVLSVTERAVKSACEIAKSLDASKDVPTTEGYPISTVAVLLIDSKKESCSLQSDGVTEGVRSLIEKEVDEAILGDERACIKRKMNEEQPLSDHTKFLQIGFDAVKDVTGIEVSDLEVLEAHVVYSLTKEKAAAQFYIMKCNKSLDSKKAVALDSLVKSLSGPLANDYDGTWVTSDLVEYHRLLPYAELISNWLRRKASSSRESASVCQDIMQEIFLCLPLTVLRTFRRVSTWWEKFLGDSDFTRALNRSGLVFSQVDKVGEGSYVTRYILVDPVYVCTLEKEGSERLLGSVRGFLLLVSGEGFIVNNPATREVLSVPFPPEIHVGSVYVCGFGKCEGSFKIVVISSSTCYVYTLGGALGWRQVPVDSGLCYDGCSRRVAFLEGRSHWLVEDQRHSPCISYFDMNSEEFGRFPVPLKSRARTSIGVLDGKLCLCNTTGGMSILTMDRYGSVSWSREVVSGENYVTEEGTENVFPIRRLPNGDIVYSCADKRIAFTTPTYENAVPFGPLYPGFPVGRDIEFRQAVYHQWSFEKLTGC